MGRFYRTASANPLDYMYKLNTPLMEKVIDTNDKYIDQNLDTTDKLGSLANYNHLEQDNDDAKAITDQYTNKINGIADAIRKDPANWRKQLDPIRGVKQDLLNNYQNGAIGKQVANFNARKTAFDEADKQVQLYHTSGGTKGVSPERAVAYKQDWDKQFTKTGFDPQTGAHNLYKGGSIMDNIDVKKVLSQGLDKIKADKSFEYKEDEAGNGWFFNKVTNKREQVTPEKILQIATDNINPQMMNYLKQDSRVGLVKGVYDDNGEFIRPYDMKKVDLSPEESKYIDQTKARINKVKDPRTKAEMLKTLDDQVKAASNRTALNWNNDSYFTPILRGLASQYSYANTEQGNDLSNNSKGSTIFNAGQAWGRQTRQLKQQEDHFTTTQKNISDRFKETNQLGKDRLAFDKYKWDNPHAAATRGTTATSAGTKANPNAPAPPETTVSKLSTNSFESVMTHDPKANKDVPLLSVAGLGSDIDNYKNQQEHISTELSQIGKALETKPTPGNQIEQNHYDLLSQRKIQLEKNLEDVNSNLNDRRNWYKATTNAVLNNDPNTGVRIEPQEAELYNKYGGKAVSELQDKIQKLKKLHPDKTTVVDSGNSVNSMGVVVGGKKTVVTEAPEVVAARKELARYSDVRNKVLQGKDQYLSTIRTNPINSDAIQLNDKESVEVGDMIANNTAGLKLFDANGKPADEKPTFDAKGLSDLFDGSSDDFKFSFAGKNNMKDYIDKTGTKIKVERVGSTTRIGNNGNAVAKVTFVDPTGVLPNTPFYIGLNHDLQRDISTKFSNHKNPEVARVGKSMGNDEANAIRTQFVSPTFDKVSGEDAPERTIFVTDKSGSRMSLKARELEDGHLFITGEDKDGKSIPFPRVGGTGKNGFFNNPEDFIEQLQALKTSK